MRVDGDKVKATGLLLTVTVELPDIVTSEQPEMLPTTVNVAFEVKAAEVSVIELPVPEIEEPLATPLLYIW